MEGGECAWGGGLKSFYKCQTMTGDQGLRRRTVINSPEKARGATQKRDSSVSSARRKKGCQGNKGSEGGEEESGREGRKEGVKERGGECVHGGGDYTIIQITAGYNLVADVSRSTMPTTHRRVCVCEYTLKEFQCPASSHRAGFKKKKTATDEPANFTTQLFIAPSGKGLFFMSLLQMRDNL